MPVSWAAASDPGLRRPSNEDSYCARADLGLFVVADGMGGHAGGEIASRLAVETIQRVVAQVDTDQTRPVGGAEAEAREGRRLRAAFLEAHRRIADRAASTAGLQDMATTAAVVLLTGVRATVAHVGDSRVYLLRGGRLDRMTADHSWVEEQVRAGALSLSAARQHPWRNVVTRALSSGPVPEVDIRTFAVEPADRLLLCSDGLSGVLGDEGIRSALGQPAPLSDVCQALVAAANAGGGPDNVTVLVLQIDAP